MKMSIFLLLALLVSPIALVASTGVADGTFINIPDKGSKINKTEIDIGTDSQTNVEPALLGVFG